MRGPRAILTALPILIATGCAPSADFASDQAAIRAVDSGMVDALNARDLDTWLGFVADDARMMPPNAPTVEGKEAIRQLLEGLLAIPTFTVTHHPGTIVVSRGGDLAYVSYAYELTVRDSQGTPVTEKGKDISIFRKQPDGSWKLVVDMWSTDEAPSQP